MQKGRKWTLLSHMTSSHPISLAGEDRTYRWTHPQLTALDRSAAVCYDYTRVWTILIKLTFLWQFIKSKEESTNQLMYPFIKICTHFLTWGHHIIILFGFQHFFNKKLKWRTCMIIWQTLWLFKHALSSKVKVMYFHKVLFVLLAWPLLGLKYIE